MRRVAQTSLVGGIGRLLGRLRSGSRDGPVLLAQLGRAAKGIRGYGRGRSSVSCSSRIAAMLVARHLRRSRLLLGGMIVCVFVGIGRRV